MTYTAPAVAVETIVGTTAVLVAVVPSINGSGSMYNAGQKPIYWGTSSGVTALTGTLLHPGADNAITLASGTNYYAVTALDKSRVLSVVFESNVPGGSGSGVSSLNALTGALSIAATGALQAVAAGSTVTISGTGQVVASVVAGSTYTLASTDCGQLKRFTGAPCTLTVPQDSTYGTAYGSGPDDLITLDASTGPVFVVSDGTAVVNGVALTSTIIVVPFGQVGQLIRTAASAWHLTLTGRAKFPTTVAVVSGAVTVDLAKYDAKITLAATTAITLLTTNVYDGCTGILEVLDGGTGETMSYVNTENSTVTAPTTSNGSTTLPLTVGFRYNAATSKWRCVASA